MNTEDRAALLFLRLCAAMTNGALNYDGYAWRIESVSELRDGEWQALWRCDWPNDKHDASACMSVFMHPQRGVSIRSETCTMGKYTNDASAALHNRYAKALKFISREAA